MTDRAFPVGHLLCFPVKPAGGEVSFEFPHTCPITVVVTR